MTDALEKFNREQVRKDLPDIKPGHIVKVYQKIKETEKVAGRSKGKSKNVTKERIQIFEGLVIAMKGRNNIDASITVRKISNGVGVERVFPLSAPTIEKIELVKKIKTRRAKLYYMRDRIGKATRPKGELVKPEENAVNIKKEEVEKEKAEVKIEETTKPSRQKKRKRNKLDIGILGNVIVGRERKFSFPTIMTVKFGTFKNQPGWRNWYTRQVEGLCPLGRAGSSPALGTRLDD